MAQAVLDLHVRVSQGTIFLAGMAFPRTLPRASARVAPKTDPIDLRPMDVGQSHRARLAVEYRVQPGEIDRPERREGRLQTVRLGRGRSGPCPADRVLWVSSDHSTGFDDHRAERDWPTAIPSRAFSIAGA